MVAESADKQSMGKAFGIHKMLDMAGSAVGILLAFLLMKILDLTDTKLFLPFPLFPLSLPCFLFFLIHEKRKSGNGTKRALLKNISQLDAG